MSVGARQWTVYFAGVCLLDKPVNSFLKALEAWMAVFWVFQVQYPSDLSFTCLFIEKYCTDGKTAVPGVGKRLAENYKMRVKHACYSLGVMNKNVN